MPPIPSPAATTTAIATYVDERLSGQRRKAEGRLLQRLRHGATVRAARRCDHRSACLCWVAASPMLRNALGRSPGGRVEPMHAGDAFDRDAIACERDPHGLGIARVIHAKER